MKTLCLLILSVFVMEGNAKADRIYIMNGSGYNNAGNELIAAMQSLGHTVTVNNSTFTLPAGFTSTCVDPVNGYDWLCFFGEMTFDPLFPAAQAFINQGGKVFYQYEVTCCSVSSSEAALFCSTMTGLPITPNANPYIAWSATHPAYTATDPSGCVTFLGDAYKGLDGLPASCQLLATANLNGSTPSVSTCTNFGFRFSPGSFTCPSSVGAFAGMGDVNVWYDGEEPWSNGGTHAVDMAVVSYFFPAPCTSCCAFPLSCTSGSGGNVAVHLGNDTTLCSGQSLTLNGTTTGATAYHWSTGATTPTITVNTTGAYWVHVTTACGTGADTLGITVVTCTVPDAHCSVSDTTICNSDCVTFTDLSTGNPTQWHWTFPGGTPHTWNGQHPPLICFDTVGTVSAHLVASNSMGSDSADIAVTLIDCSPHAHFAAGDTVICHGVCISYLNTSTNNPTAWNWSFNGGTPAASNLQNPPLICYPASGTYSTTLIVHNNYGADTAFQIIHVLPCNIPVAAFSVSDTGICATDCITFTNNSTYDTGWSWSFPGGVPSSSSQQNPGTVCYAAPGNYTVRLIAFNAYGADTSIQQVHVHNCTPHAGFSISDTSICKDSCVGFTNASYGNLAVFHWYFSGGNPASFVGASPPVVCWHGTGTFMVKLVVSSPYGADSAMHSITVHGGPAISVSPSSSAINMGGSIQLNASGGLLYFWHPGSGLSDSLVGNPVASPVATITYYVTATDVDGCASQDSALVAVIPKLYFPDAFSPNSDGKNDVFRMLNPQDVTELKIEIFNRWGQLVYESNTPYFGWDGTFKGTPQEVDVYIWEAHILAAHSSDYILMKGNVSLLR